MSNLINEIVLRLLKAFAALILGAILYLILVGPLGAAATPELALLAWISAAAFILLVETSPI